MTIKNAITKARERGEEMSKGIKAGAFFAFDQGDIADIVTDALGATHPLSSMPNQETDFDAFLKWQHEQDSIREQLWNAFAEAVRNGTQ